MSGAAPNIKAVRTKKAESIKAQKVFFPNLDALRFICFFLVFLFHCYKTVFAELRTADGFGGQVYSTAQFLFQNGELGVNFFFVLSGFLITYLLIRETECSGTIHLRNFYLRRVLRIWPLFYLCVLIGFVVIPLLKSFAGQPSDENASLFHYIFFLNNFDYLNNWPAFPDALILIVLWSVAVEEQFYLSWPLILKWLNRRIFPIIFIAIIVGTMVFRFFHLSDSEEDFAIRHFHTLSVIGDMAFGALLAYWSSYDSMFLRFVKNMSRWLIILIYIGAIALILFRYELFDSQPGRVAERLVISIFFGLIILEQNYARNSFYKLERLRRTSRLGLYTYGLYCLHFFVISLVQGGMQKMGFSFADPLIAISSVILSLLGLIGLCYLSYHYFEKPFLKLKDKFAVITKR